MERGANPLPFLFGCVAMERQVTTLRRDTHRVRGVISVFSLLSPVDSCASSEAE
jgi:hypothetical protein